MSYRVWIEGNESFEIVKECVCSVRFTSDIAIDSGERTEDQGNILVIRGKIGGSDDVSQDCAIKLALWSLIPAGQPDCYRKITVEYTAAGVRKRNYVFTDAFIVKYRETFREEEDSGDFTLVVGQKNDRLDMVTVEGESLAVL